MTNKERAILIAEAAHGSQAYGLYPYIYHLKKVAEIAEDFGFDDLVIVSCILHDALEDTSLSYNDIKKEFGFEVAEIVYAVTDELGRNRNERHNKTYPKIRSNWRAVAVKVCDRIANLRESITSNNKMAVLYLSEYDSFVKGVKVLEHTQTELLKAWAELDCLIENQLRLK